MSQNSITNYTAKNGAIIGGGYILSYLITHFINGGLHTTNDVSGNICSILLIAGIIIFTRKYRVEQEKAQFTYGEAFKIGFFIALFSAIVGGFYLYVYYSYVSPESVEKYLILQQNTFLLSGMTEDQSVQMTQIMKGIISPGFLAFTTLLGNIIFGTIVSLITSAFLKKTSGGVDAFSQSMSEIEDKEKTE